MGTHSNHQALRLTGLAGFVGAIAWTLGDALIVGEHAPASAYPLLMQDYADRISFGGLANLLPASEPRLAAGALLADIAIPLYLLGSWHLYQGVRSAGRATAWPILALLVCGNAWSPLGHAAFYFVGMLYKTLLAVPTSAHAALLELGEQFYRVLLMAWLLPVASLGLALLLLGIAIARGRTRYPRWAALLLNPVTFMAVGTGFPWLTPEPLRTWLGGAGFNISWLFAYGVSLAMLWHGGRRAIPEDVPRGQPVIL